MFPLRTWPGKQGPPRAGGRARGAEALAHFVFSSFSSSVSLREAFTLLDTSCPWEKRRWRSLKVRFSGAPVPAGTPASWLQGGRHKVTRHHENQSTRSQFDIRGQCSKRLVLR